MIASGLRSATGSVVPHDAVAHAIHSVLHGQFCVAKVVIEKLRFKKLYWTPGGRDSPQPRTPLFMLQKRKFQILLRNLEMLKNSGQTETEKIRAAEFFLRNNKASPTCHEGLIALESAFVVKGSLFPEGVGHSLSLEAPSSTLSMMDTVS